MRSMIPTITADRYWLHVIEFISLLEQIATPKGSNDHLYLASMLNALAQDYLNGNSRALSKDEDVFLCELMRFLDVFDKTIRKIARARHDHPKARSERSQDRTTRCG